MSKDLEWEYADPAVSEEQIREIGLQLGFYFPDDYIECVKVNGGASVYPDEFSVGIHDRAFGSLLSFNGESSEYIIKTYQIYKPTLPKELFPISNDPAGNLICFDYKNHEKSPIVVFWEHENAGNKEMLKREESLTEEQVEELARENVFFVADNFMDFLNKLHD